MLADAYIAEIETRLRAIDTPEGREPVTRAAEIIARGLRNGGVIHVFGTGHSQAFAMEIAGRAGGLIPTNALTLRAGIVAMGEDPAGTDAALAERDPKYARAVFALAKSQPGDVFLVASNSGVNGSIVEFALAVCEAGHPLIAVTSVEHTEAVLPKHPSGKRLRDLADVVIDNRAPYGDATLALGNGEKVGSVSSITAAFIAQLITVLVAEDLFATEGSAPVYLSANIPGGDEHNRALEDRYAGRLLRTL